jgi:predicted protein tyrosine phosphatase
MVAAHHPDRVVSLLDPGLSFPNLGPAYAHRHLRLSLHDVHDTALDQVAPGAAHVDQLLSFLRRWRRSAPLLIHCRAGIGRSTAVAFIAVCLHHPDRDEREIAINLRTISPLARPNETLVKLADCAMSRDGRMAKAIEETGRGLAWHHVTENHPFELALSKCS